MLSRALLIGYILVLMCSAGYAYPIDRLYKFPGGEASFIFPDFYNIKVLEVLNYPTSVWVRVEVNIAFLGRYHYEGWIYVPKEAGK